MEERNPQPKKNDANSRHLRSWLQLKNLETQKKWIASQHLEIMCENLHPDVIFFSLGEVPFCEYQIWCHLGGKYHSESCHVLIKS